jgi:hypothetical protein
MPNTDRLLEQVRRVVPRHTDYAIAKALEMNQSDLGRVMCGKQGLGVKAAVRISELLQRDLRDVIVLIEEDKATRPKDIDFWSARSPRITAAVAIAALAVAAVVRTTVDAPTTGYIASGQFTDLYIMRNSSWDGLLTFLKRLFFRTFVRSIKQTRIRAIFSASQMRSVNQRTIGALVCP